LGESSTSGHDPVKSIDQTIGAARVTTGCLTAVAWNEPADLDSKQRFRMSQP